MDNSKKKWLRNFLTENKELILENNYTELYKKLDSYKYRENTGIVTSLLFKTGINPLDYMSEIPPYMFYNSGINTIDIPPNITKIEYDAFYRCTSLTSITIPESVTSIGAGAFDGCASLKILNIPSNLNNFNVETFPPALSAIQLPATVNLILSSKTNTKNILSKIKYPIWIGSKQFINGNKLFKELYPELNPLTLYRVRGHLRTLIAKKSSRAKKTGVAIYLPLNAGLQGSDCPCFFETLQDANNFISNCEYLGVLTPGIAHPYMATLTSKDTSFTLINTDVGKCLIQGWRDRNIPSSAIVQQNYITR